MKKYLLMVVLAVFVMACSKMDNESQTAAPQSTPGTAEQAKKHIEEGMNFLKSYEMPTSGQDPQDIVNAINSFDNAIKVDPQNPDNYMVLGQVYLRLRNYDKAVDTFSAGTRISPENGELYYFLGAANAVRYHMNDDGRSEFYLSEGIIAAKRSVEIFVQQKDEEKFKRALALLKSLQEGGDIGKVPEQASN